MRLLAIVPPPEARWGERGQEALACADALHNLARYLTRNPSDAEELVQETYARAFRSWEQFTPGTDLEAWLCRILRNTLISRQRQERRMPMEGGHDTVDPSGRGSAQESWLRDDFELERMRRLVGEEIEEALRSLPEEQRTVILLDLQDLTEAEAALVIGCPVGTVKSRLSRARAALRNKLANYAR